MRRSSLRRLRVLATVFAASVLMAIIAFAGPPQPTAGVRVRVLGPGDLEVPGAELFLDEGGAWKLAGKTGTDGSLVLAGVAPADGRMAAARFERDEYDAKHASLSGVRLDAADVVLRVPHALRLELAGVDGQTGAFVLGTQWRVPYYQTKESYSDGALELPVGFGAPLPGFEIKAPPGWLATRDFAGWMWSISPDVGRARAVVSLRREARIRVVVTADLGSIASIVAVRWRFLPREMWAEALPGPLVTHRPGPVVLQGVPWFPGARIELQVECEDPKTSQEIDFDRRAVLPANSTDMLEVKVSESDPEPEFEPGPPDHSEGLIGVGGGFRNDLSKTGGHLDVRVVRANGRPLPPLVLSLVSQEQRELADLDRSLPAHMYEVEVRADGTGSIDGVFPGEYRLTLGSNGLLPTTASVAIKAGERAAVTLTEPLGCSLVVMVTDGVGHPLPLARLELIGHTAVDVRDGVQRLDPFVGVDGLRTLSGVEPGPIVVRATWGARSGESRIVLKDGGTEKMELRLVDSAEPK